MKHPCILTLPELLAPLKRAHDKLDEITFAQIDFAEFARSSENKKLAAIANEGIFTLVVSTFEVMLSDVLICYLRHFPEKMEFKDSKFTKEQVIGATFARELLEIKGETLVRSKMYKDVSTVLDYFLTTLAIKDCPLDQDLINNLTELKQTRNLLLHADLVVNSTYLEKAGPAARAKNTGQRLAIDDVYLGGCLSTLKFFLIEINQRLVGKYSSYTRLAALKRIWDYMVANPTITPFAEFWEIDVVEDVIRPRHNPEAEQRMGSSEKLFLALWRDSLNGIPLSSADGHLSMLCLDRRSVAKVAVFLFAAKRMGVIAN